MVGLLLLVAALVTLVCRWLKVPYTIGLVAAGVGLASLGVLDGAHLTKELIFQFLLPPLIFEAGFFIRWKDLKVDLAPVLTFAVGGVVITAVVIAPTMALLGNWSWPAAMLFATLIAATDPVSVIAMFKELRVEGRLRLLVEAESLLNDGVAAVLFSVALVLATGQALTPSLAVVSFLREAGGGLACGALVATLVLVLMGRTNDHIVELTLTTVAAFGSFLLAEQLHCSGVLATLIAGLALGNLGHLGSLTNEGREAVTTFWEFAAFIANSIVFLLIGAREHALGFTLMKHAGLVALAIAASLVGRALSIYGLSLVFRGTERRISVPHQHILIWGGLKGALSLALALGLPETMPFHEEILAVTFGVVAFSVVAQGMTMPLLLRKLKLNPVND